MAYAKNISTTTSLYGTVWQGRSLDDPPPAVWELKPGQTQGVGDNPNGDPSQWFLFKNPNTPGVTQQPFWAGNLSREDIVEANPDTGTATVIAAEATIGNHVRLDPPKISYSPTGPLQSILGSSPIDDKVTSDITTQSYRMGKFMQSLSQIDFDDLQEVEQSDGSTVMVYDGAIDGQDFNFTISQADLLRSIKLTEADDSAIAAAAAKYKIDPSKTSVTIDDKKYLVSMNVPLHFGSEQTNQVLVEMGVFLLGDGALTGAIAAAIATFGNDAFKEAVKRLTSTLFKAIWTFVKTIVKASYHFLRELFLKLIGRTPASWAEALNAAKTAVRSDFSAAVEGIELASVGYFFAGALILLIIVLIVELVLHQTYQNVFVYNLTDKDLVLSLNYTYEGTIYNLDNPRILAAQAKTGPGGMNLGTWYNGTAFRMQSDSELHGIGYAMGLALQSPTTHDDVDTFAIMFDLPYAGDNSLCAQLGTPSNFQQFYSQNEGVHKITQLSAKNAQHEIVVTYDFLSGKHVDPQSGETVYIYNSLVVVRPMT